MQVTVDRKSFLSALETAMVAVARSAYRPVLKQVRLLVDDDSVSIAGTDVELLAEVRVAGTVKSPGLLIVDPKPLRAILKTAPKGGTVGLGTVAGDDGRASLVVDLDGNLSSVPIEYGPDEWPIPALVRTESVGGTLTLEAGTLRRAIERALPSVARYPGRYSMHGLLIEPARIVATDGRRLVVVPIDGTSGGPGKVRAIVPAGVCKALAKAIGKARGLVELAQDDGGVWCRLIVRETGAVLTFRAIDGEFPRFEAIVPSADRAGVSFRVDSEGLLSALAGAAAILPKQGETRAVTLERQIPEGAVTLQAMLAGARATRSCPVDGLAERGEKGRKVSASVALDADYLKDGLTALGGTVTVGWREKGEPVRFAADDGTVYVLMSIVVDK